MRTFWQRKTKSFVLAVTAFFTLFISLPLQAISFNEMIIEHERGSIYLLHDGSNWSYANPISGHDPENYIPFEGNIISGEMPSTIACFIYSDPIPSDS